MSRNRHSDENRVRTGSTPARTRRMVDWYRRMATQRKLLLLECAIIRHAPFAGCGRPLWDLMVDQRWFDDLVPSANWIRWRRDRIRAAATGPAGDEPPWQARQMNGHDAIRSLEEHADSPDDDRLVYAMTYVSDAFYSAEGEMFNPADLCDELESQYGAAWWLNDLRGDGPELGNILDYYLGDFPGEFDAWNGWRPFHPDHRGVAVGLIGDILWHPDRSVRFDAAWRTPGAVAIAAGMYESRDFAPAPALADALEEAGCDNRDALDHCRSGWPHARGCWVVDRVLGKP